jgi:hypothetical protein
MGRHKAPILMVGASIALALIFALGLQPRASANGSPPTLQVSFLRGEQLMRTPRPGRTPLDGVRQLLTGPTSAEAATGLRTYIPAGTRLKRLTVRAGVATIDLGSGFARGSDDVLLARVGQVVQTLSQFRGVQRVRLLADSKRIERTVARVPLDRPVTMRFLQTPDVPVPEPPPERLKPPDPATKKAQLQLIALGYLIPGDADGRFGPTTSEGLLAFQKFEGLDRTGVLDTATKAALPVATRPTPLTRVGPGKRAEVLLDRQVTLLINNDRVVRTIAVSSGKASTPTPTGLYHVYAKIPRWWSTPFREWLPWAIPFVGGYAFHEFAFVPAYPASHGCVRQSFAVARWTYAFAEVGMPVRIIARST